MNQRRLVVMLICCLVNWFWLVLVSAEEDDARMEPTTTTTSVQQDAMIDDIPDDGSNNSQASEINKTYPDDKYPSEEYKQENKRSSAPDGKIEATNDAEDQVKMQEDELRNVVTSSDSASESHEDQSVNKSEINGASDSIDNPTIPNSNENTIEDTEAERQDEGYDKPEGRDEMETESTRSMEGEKEELSSRIEQTQGAEESSENTRDPMEDLGTLDEILIELDDVQKVESDSSINEDTAGDTKSSPNEPSPLPKDIQHKDEQDGAAMTEDDLAEKSNSHSELTSEGNGDIRDERSSNTSAETDRMPEGESTEHAVDGDDDSPTNEETVMVADQRIENNEGSQVFSTEKREAEDTPPRDETIKSHSENEIIDKDSGGDGDESQTNELETHGVYEDSSSSESTEPASPDHEMTGNRHETTSDQLHDERSEGSSYRGLWGTPMVGTRPPDMELLYELFESRIQKQLGIGPIPKSELRENIFPLGIGYDGEVDTKDEETVLDDGDGSAPAQAKLQDLKDSGDANSEFVEGLDDIDKFFEGVDPPDELDVGASGSSMQDMLVKKGKEILIKRFLMGIKIVREGFMIARKKISARFSELKKKDIDIQAIAKTVWSKTIQMYEAVVGFVDGLLDFGGSNEEAAEDFEDFKRKTMEELQQQQDIKH